MIRIDILLALVACLMLCTASFGAAGKPRIPVILDTDIGDDIDDTWALALLLKSPEVDLKMVVADYRNTTYRARLIAKLLTVAGRSDIPIGLGLDKADRPGNQSGWLGDYDLKSYAGAVHDDGIGAMIELIMNSPVPITLVCIGPVPNIAAALQREPRIATRARFVGMHGSVRKGYNGSPEISAEWNVKADPAACRAVLSAPWDVTITPLDTCGIVVLRGEKYAAIRDSKDPLTAAVIENYRVWSQKRPDQANTASSVLYDTVAAYLSFSEELLKMERLGIRVLDDGKMAIDPTAKQMNVATEWKDLGAFEDLLVQRFAGAVPAAPRAPGNARLPKVRIAADGRSFVAGGRPYMPFGVNYYRPGTGWAPKIWRMFDADATARDLALLAEYGGNCIRVFCTYGSMYMEKGALIEEGMAKFDRLLELAEANGLYVHPTGPDHWEGEPAWLGRDHYSNETLEALEGFWKLFAARYKGRNVIFAYDLRNEPMVPWDAPSLRTRWSAFVKDRYGTAAAAAKAWGLDAVDLNHLPIPEDKDKPGDRMLLDYQLCREDAADEWTRRQVRAIKSADPDAMVTVGNIQWSVPANTWRPSSYGAFNPHRQAPLLDFMEFHFYPLERGGYEYDDPIIEQRNLSYLEAVAREFARTGKPVVLAEFGWYGGGTYSKGRTGGDTKFASEQQQAEFVAKLVSVTDGLVCGWLNWGLYDHPEARDVSRCTGLFTVDGRPKAWGVKFKELAAHYAGRQFVPRTLSGRPELPWEACVTDSAAARAFRDEYLKAFSAR